MQIIEIQSKRTLEGEVTTYMVRGGTGEDQVLPIEQIDGEVFDAADKLKKTLIDRASTSITQRVDLAATKAKEWYPTGFEATGGDSLAAIRKAPLSPGQVPASKPRKQKVQPPQSAELAMLAAELQSDSGKLEMELPNGQKVSVKSIQVPPELQG